MSDAAPDNVGSRIQDRRIKSTNVGAKAPKVAAIAADTTVQLVLLSMIDAQAAKTAKLATTTADTTLTRILEFRRVAISAEY